MGLDVIDFIKEKGGDPERIRESQRRRNASVEAVDEVIALYEDHRASAFKTLPSCIINLLTESHSKLQCDANEYED